MQSEIDTKQLRSFGLIVAGIFGLIGLWPLVIYGADLRWWSIIIALILLLPAAVFPKALYRVYRIWMAAGHVMGWINTRIILGLVFYLVVTPIGILRRWLGKDSMGRKLKPDHDSYRIICSPRPPSHLKKQY